MRHPFCGIPFGVPFCGIPFAASLLGYPFGARAALRFQRHASQGPQRVLKLGMGLFLARSGNSVFVMPNRVFPLKGSPQKGCRRHPFWGTPFGVPFWGTPFAASLLGYPKRDPFSARSGNSVFVMPNRVSPYDVIGETRFPLWRPSGKRVSRDSQNP